MLHFKCLIFHFVVSIKLVCIFSFSSIRPIPRHLLGLLDIYTWIRHLAKLFRPEVFLLDHNNIVMPNFDVDGSNMSSMYSLKHYCSSNSVSPFETNLIDGMNLFSLVQD